MNDNLVSASTSTQPDFLSLAALIAREEAFGDQSLALQELLTYIYTTGRQLSTISQLGWRNAINRVCFSVV